MKLKERIRVLQISSNLGIGGLERVVSNLCMHLNPQLFDVSACCLRFKGHFGEELEKKQIPVHLLPQVTTGPDRTAFLRLRSILKQISPHIVHSHNTNSFIDTIMASIGLHIPVKINTDHARNFPGRFSERVMESLCALFADQFIAVTNETRSNLIKYEKISSHKIQIINNGIDGSLYTDSIDVVKKKVGLGIPVDGPVIGLGVRLTPQKGIIHLIHAAPAIIKQFPKANFLIAGQGVLKDNLIRETEKLNISKNFYFLGPRHDLSEILKVLDIYVLPSEWEGLPLSLLEAMAAGCCIVATKVGGIPLALEDGHSGTLVGPKNPESLSKAIISLLQDSLKRTEFSKHAQQRFEEAFSITRMVKDHENLYLKLLNIEGSI